MNHVTLGPIRLSMDAARSLRSEYRSHHPLYQEQTLGSKPTLPS